MSDKAPAITLTGLIFRYPGTNERHMAIASGTRILGNQVIEVMQIIEPERVDIPVVPVNAIGILNNLVEKPEGRRGHQRYRFLDWRYP